MDDQRTPPPSTETPAAAPGAASGPTYRRVELDGLVIETDLPDNIPVMAAEMDLFELYFADLIDAILQQSP